MTGAEIVLGALAGVALGTLITALRFVLVRRFDSRSRPTVPPSAEVLDAEHRARPSTRPTTSHRRTR